MPKLNSIPQIGQQMKKRKPVNKATKATRKQ